MVGQICRRRVNPCLHLKAERGRGRENPGKGRERAQKGERRWAGKVLKP